MVLCLHKWRRRPLPAKPTCQLSQFGNSSHKQQAAVWMIWDWTWCLGTQNVAKSSVCPSGALLNLCMKRRRKRSKKQWRVFVTYCYAATVPNLWLEVGGTSDILKAIHKPNTQYRIPYQSVPSQPVSHPHSCSFKNRQPAWAGIPSLPSWFHCLSDGTNSMLNGIHTVKKRVSLFKGV